MSVFQPGSLICISRSSDQFLARPLRFVGCETTSTRSQHHLQAAQTLEKLISYVLGEILRSLFALHYLGHHLQLLINIFADKPSAHLVPLNSCARISGCGVICELLVNGLSHRNQLTLAVFSNRNGRVIDFEEVIALHTVRDYRLRCVLKGLGAPFRVATVGETTVLIA